MIVFLVKFISLLFFYWYLPFIWQIKIINIIIQSSCLSLLRPDLYHILLGFKVSPHFVTPGRSCSSLLCRTQCNVFQWNSFLRSQWPAPCPFTAEMTVTVTPITRGGNARDDDVGGRAEIAAPPRQTLFISICHRRQPAGDAGDVSPPIFGWWGYQWECPHQYSGWQCSGIWACNRQCEKKATLSFKK